jgi:hypothetical protein
MNRVYLLSFDPYKTDAKMLHQVITSSLQVKDWWHYIGSCYLIVSTAQLSTLHAEIMRRWPKQRFLLMEVSLRPDNNNGLLPQDAWTWIRKYY